MSDLELLKARSQARRCRACDLCDRSVKCGWKQGLLLSKHRPDKWGMVLTGKTLPDGRGIFAFQETREGASEREDVKELLDTFSDATTVLVARLNGQVSAIMGPKAQEVLDLFDDGKD